MNDEIKEEKLEEDEGLIKRVAGSLRAVAGISLAAGAVLGAAAAHYLTKRRYHSGWGVVWADNVVLEDGIKHLQIKFQNGSNQLLKPLKD